MAHSGGRGAGRAVSLPGAGARPWRMETRHPISFLE